MSLLGDALRSKWRCLRGDHSRVKVSMACGHRDVCIRCRDHPNGESCPARRVS